MTGLIVENLVVDLAHRPVLKGASFLAKPGELVGLIGPNGAGKTTLLRAIGQLIAPRAGTIAWAGRPLSGLTIKARAQTLSYLPQGHIIHWSMPVRCLVEFGRLPRLGPMSRLNEGDHAAVDRALDAADVTGLADRLTSNLSGGEQARVLLARALAVEAPILLADEPAASLDPSHALGVMAVLRRQADAGGLIIVVMHELGLVARFCDRLILINEGSIVADGSPEAVLTPERLREVYGVEPDPHLDQTLSLASALATLRQSAR